jgi:hypothetical protein
MSSRSDIHRPSEIVPDDYQFVSHGYLGGNTEELAAQRIETEIRLAHFKRTRGRFLDIVGGCQVCGNNRVLYVSYYHYEKTNSYLRVGWRCAEKLEMYHGQGKARAFRKRIGQERKNRAGKAKAGALLSDAGLDECWALYEAEYDEAFRYEEHTIRDIVSGLVRYGSISEKQQAFLRKLLDQLLKREEIEALRAAEEAAALPAPEGRMEITGKVLTVKVQDGDWGPTTKMLVKHADGWKVWLTVPMSIYKAKRGDEVTLTATLAPSKNDPKFAIGKRPSKAAIIPAEPAGQSPEDEGAGDWEVSP